MEKLSLGTRHGRPQGGQVVVIAIAGVVIGWITNHLLPHNIDAASIVFGVALGLFVAALQAVTSGSGSKRRSE